ncbi:TIR domain-containing protein [Candidatus Thiosymbion oneisti]|uniref:TIR domain-containing protein n=1 Tax=Candidatus Thiosymbion oneisti TaxID=589554 RepID=UPI000B7E230F|nr:TIR domain-containing protein [Candidatus Thiosymbion oneisti]
MGRKVFVSYSHRLDQDAADDFRKFFADERDVFIDKSIRDDVGELEKDAIKRKLRTLIKDSSITVVLIGSQTGGRWWVDWEIYNSLRKNEGNERNGLLGIHIKYKEHWVPDRLTDNIPTMGHVIDWPSNYRTLANQIEAAYDKRWNTPNLSRPLRQKNSSRR